MVFLTYWSIGIDIVEIQRFRSYPLLDYPRFYERVFDEYEFQYCTRHSDPYPHFAGIFAGKEAVLKAINKLFPISLSEIFIHHDDTGRPVVWLEKNENSPKSREKWFINNQNLEVQVTITHSSDLALAWALIFTNNSRNDPFRILDKLKAELQREIENEFVEYRCTT